MVGDVVHVVDVVDVVDVVEDFTEADSKDVVE